jgi:hypothetical protein
VSYHHVIADITVLVTLIGMLLAQRLKEGSAKKNDFAVIFACVALLSLTILLFGETRFYLEDAPIMAMSLLWELEKAVTKGFRGSGRCPQTDTIYLRANESHCVFLTVPPKYNRIIELPRHRRLSRVVLQMLLLSVKRYLPAPLRKLND